MIYEPATKVATFGKATETLLRANLNRTVFPSWEKTERSTAEELLAMRRQVPKLRPFKFHNFQNAVYHITKGHMAHLKSNFEQQAKLKSENFQEPVTRKDIAEDMEHISIFRTLIRSTPRGWPCSSLRAPPKMLR